jgi:glycosyltransferase involved in cell wall biosynthesis
MIHSSFATRGGAERYVRDLSRELVSRGHELRVFCRPSENSQPADHHVDRRVSTRLAAWLPRLRKVFGHLGDLLDPTGIRVRDIRDFAPDIVHVHNWQELGVLPIARLARTYPTCHTVHDYAICDPNNSLRNLGHSKAIDALLKLRSAWLVRKLQPVVLLWPTERTRDTVHKHTPTASRLADKIVPLAVLAPNKRSTWPPGRKNVFLFLGALSEHKGIDVLLRAWRDIQREINAILLIAGDGVRKREVEQLARMDSSIRYLGYLDNAGKESAMLAAGWLVFPSRWVENFPIACVEALIAGRPIISSAIARPTMASDKSILVFHNGEELRQVLTHAARLPDDEYNRLSSSAAADGRAVDWDDHVETVIQTYETLQAKGGRTSARPGVYRADH